MAKGTFDYSPENLCGGGAQSVVTSHARPQLPGKRAEPAPREGRYITAEQCHKDPITFHALADIRYALRMRARGILV